MSPPDPDTAFAVLRAADPEVMDRDQLAELAMRLKTHRAQRAGLRAMHRTCIGATCTVPFDACQVHHVIPWEEGGPTDLSNLAPLCTEHHHLAHEGGWTLTLTPDRIATWTRPDGTTYWTGNTIDRAPNGMAKAAA